MNRRIVIGLIAVLGAVGLAVAILLPFGPSADVTAREEVARFEGGSPDQPVPGEPVTAKAIRPEEQYPGTSPDLPGTGQSMIIGVTQHQDAPGEGNLLPVSPFPGTAEGRAAIRADGEGNLLPVSPLTRQTKFDDSGTMDFERSGAASRVIRPTEQPYLDGSPDLPATGPTLALEEESTGPLVPARVAVPLVTMEDFLGSDHEYKEVIKATGDVIGESPALGEYDFRAITREDFVKSNYGSNGLTELKGESKDVAVARGAITSVHRSNFNPYARPWDEAEAAIWLNFAEPERSEAVELANDNAAHDPYRTRVDGFYIFPGSWGDEGGK